MICSRKKSFLFFSPSMCYHNTREVATHKIRNTVTHGYGYSPCPRDNCTRSLPIGKLRIRCRFRIEWEVTFYDFEQWAQADQGTG